MAATATRIRRAASTVKTHRANILRKLGARNAAHAVGLAYSSGLLASSAAPRTEITSGQVRAFHGKLHTLAKRRRLDRHDLKAELLDQASVMFGRKISGLHDLSAIELSQLLDEMEDAAVLAAVQDAA